MKISDMIEILKINSVPFIPLPPGYGEKGQLTIYATDKGICYWEDATIWFINIDENNKDFIYNIGNELKSNFYKLNDNHRELNKYLAVCQLLMAINKYKLGDGELPFGQIKKYVDCLNTHIYNSLDFNEISHMNDLIERIKEDSLYKELYFTVNEIKCRKSDRYRGYKNEENHYSFGNIRYHEKTDIVRITAYYDCVEMTFEPHGLSLEIPLDMRREHSLEGKIFSILDKLISHYNP